MMHEDVPERLKTEKIEYTDERGWLLLLASANASLPLCRKRVAVLVRDARRRLFVRRLAEGDVRWDVAAVTFVRDGESRQEAAERALRETLGIGDIALTEVWGPTFLEEEKVLLTLYGGDVAAETVFPTAAGVFLDEDEVSGLADQMPELLTSALLRAIREKPKWKRAISTR